ncbi:unnamed protein product [Didymodactylos carnosus]|uniref:Uncharacterized protein n=1 Tax=Didymodactylos carnosus TaxID=1234261 RepID=A0A814EN72_9BILA|nr:unnamed protein product [Didymodactylos carnosus]CAF3742753.1 unnamed protein product [Didymodactylos carnosus]
MGEVTTISDLFIDEDMKERNIDEFTLVWLDDNIDKKSKDDACKQFRSIINYLKIFDNLEECYNYILTVSNEKIFLIVSSKFALTIVQRIHRFEKIVYIYILCLNPLLHEKWTKKYSSVIRGVYNDKQLLVGRLAEDFQNGEPFSYALMLLCKPMTVVSPSSVTATPTNEPPKYMDYSWFTWYQILIDVILNMDYMLREKQNMLNECKQYFNGNVKELQRIDEFDRNCKLSTINTMLEVDNTIGT